MYARSPMKRPQVLSEQIFSVESLERCVEKCVPIAAIQDGR